MLTIGQTMQNSDHYLKDGHLMPPERPQIDMPPSLVVLSIVTNTVGAALTLMRASTPVCTGFRAAAGSWKYRVISNVDGWSVTQRLVGWREMALL